MKLFASKVFIYAILLFFVSKIEYNYLKPIFEAESLIFPYAIHPFDICKQFPNTWNLIKNIYIVSFWSSFTIIYFNVAKSICEANSKLSTKFEQNVDKTNINKHFPKPNNLLKITPLKSISSKNAQKSSNLVLNIGRDEQGNIITIPEKGLYQNILITGTIGCGKTSSAMYPFSKQLIEYEANNNQEKLGILALDVKGNFANQIKKYACKVGREKDLIVINLDGIVKYNPLDKPDLKPAVLANRLRKILELFSKNSTESYWLDKSEQIISQAIKLCRLYNDGYVTFLEIHKIVFFKDYYEEKLKHIKELFKKSSFKEDEVYDLISCIDFFEKEFYSLDSRTSAILKSEISLITNLFISDYNVSNTFCPAKEDINFKGFEDMLNTGKIVLLQMNVSEYKNLSKLIATYLKLDYQTAVMKQLSNSN
nr:hypothetical protein [Clostridia bacterium]